MQPPWICSLTEVTTLCQSLKKRTTDVLAYFHRPGTSKGPTGPSTDDSDTMGSRQTGTLSQTLHELKDPLSVPRGPGSIVRESIDSSQGQAGQPVQMLINADDIRPADLRGASASARPSCRCMVSDTVVDAGIVGSG